MTKLLRKLACLFLPYLVINLVAACLPLNALTFRCWEALRIYKRSAVLTGPFYPLQRLSMVEEGDLGHGTPYAVRKSALWETDRFGFRTAPVSGTPDVVIVGDSNTAGTGLSQEGIISEALRRRLGATVYPHAPGDIHGFLRDTRFRGHLPKVVILQEIEHSIPGSRPIDLGSRPRPSSAATDDSLLVRGAIVLDRMRKTELLYYLQSKLSPTTIGYRYQGMFFKEGEAAAIDCDAAMLEKIADTIAGYRDYFAGKGVRFVYLPLPNKETVYYDLLPSKRRSTFLRRLVEKLKERKVLVVDLLEPYGKLKDAGIPPYRADDTHWSQAGVNAAADLIADALSPEVRRDDAK